MFNTYKLRQLYESYAGEGRQQSGGRYGFVRWLRNGLGLCDENGNDYKDRYGNRVLRESVMDTGEFAFNDLALAMMGPQVREWFGMGDGYSRALRYRTEMMTTHPDDQRALLEAVGMGIDVSAFADINAWTAATGGLLERKILENLDHPSFIGDELMPSETTKINEGQKVIGISEIGDKAIERLPGMPHARAGVKRRYVTLGKARENGLAVDVLREAAFFDLTGQLMEEAGGVGWSVGYRKEIDQIDAFIGVTTQSTGLYKFVYDGTAYDTYSLTQNIGEDSIANSNQVANELIDWTSLETAKLMFTRMRNPDTGIRVAVQPDTMLVNPGKEATAHLIVGASETETRTAGSSTQATAGTLQIRRTSGTPFKYKVVVSPYVEQRCTDSDGLALSQANATKYWWLFQRGKGFKYMVHFPATITQAPVTNYEMIDRGVIASFFCTERGFPSCWAGPWYGVRNTN